MNRGSQTMAGADDPMRVASMRPRFMNRGSLHDKEPRRCLTTGFNEAPIHESGKCLRNNDPAYSLNMASMRPRFMNRGSVAP